MGPGEWYEICCTRGTLGVDATALDVCKICPRACTRDVVSACVDSAKSSQIGMVLAASVCRSGVGLYTKVGDALLRIFMVYIGETDYDPRSLFPV